MLVNAVKITDPWYEQERTKLTAPPQQATPSRPYQTPAVKPLANRDTTKAGWWEFWK